MAALVCPAGSYCDDIEGICTLKCDGSTTAGLTCTTAGEICGCDGKCAPACKPVVVVKPTLGLSTGRVTLAPPSR